MCLENLHVNKHSPKGSDMSHTAFATALITMVVLISLSPSADADLVAVVSVGSPTELSVTLSGNFLGSTPIQFDQNLFINFGTSNYPSGNIDPIAVSGGYNVPEATGVLLNDETFTFAEDAIQVIFNSSPFFTGQELSGTATFTYDTNHGIVVGETFDVFWGIPATGTFQSSGVTTAVPEPSASLLIFGIGMATWTGRRRRDPICT